MTVSSAAIENANQRLDLYRYETNYGSALRDCIVAFAAEPTAKYAAHLHHEDECEPIAFFSNEPLSGIADRIGYMVMRKPIEELTARFMVMRPVSEETYKQWSEKRKEVDQSYSTAVHAAQDAYHKGDMDYETLSTKSAEAEANRVAAGRALHGMICTVPRCPWNGYTIFPEPEPEPEL